MNLCFYFTIHGTEAKGALPLIYISSSFYFFTLTYILTKLPKLTLSLGFSCFLNLLDSWD